MRVLLGFITLISISVWCQSTVDISGTITNALKQPIAGAEVQLTGYSLNAISDIDGKYQLNGSLTGLAESRERSMIRFSPNRLYLIMAKEEKILLEVFNVSGQNKIQLVNTVLKKGEHIFPIQMKNLSPKILFLRIKIGDNSHVYKVLNFSNFQVHLEKEPSLQKKISIDEIGTLEVGASGYLQKSVPVENWVSTIDITLQVESNPHPIAKSMILFTQASSATEENTDRYKANGIFWGHMPQDDIESESSIQNWASKVNQYRANGLDYVGRGEFDWGWKWMVDYMENPGDYWVKDFNGNNVLWGNGETYNGQQHGWQSHQGPEFLGWLKFQVDKLLVAPVTHMMFDSQTSATRTLNWFGGDFSIPSLSGFNNYLEKKYTTAELSTLGIADINTFHFGSYLKNKGYNIGMFKSCVSDIQDTEQICADFVYYQRQILNEVMEDVLAYIDVQAPNVAVGATTSLMEPRGYIFSERLDYLAGELSHTVGPADGVPFEVVTHYKAAEAVGKTLILFPYPAAWTTIRDRDTPRHARTWIAQAYAMGAIFSIPGNIWVNPGTWNPGWENYFDVYQFVRSQEALLDNYEPLSNVGYVYPVLASIKGGMNGSDITQASTKKLIEENYSFDYLIFGDPGHPIVSTVEQLNQYDILITDGESGRLSTTQNEMLASANPDVVSIYDENEISRQLSKKIDVMVGSEGVQNSRISVFPRKSSDPNAPYVIHLINRKYNPSLDQSVSHTGVSVNVSSGLFEKPVTSASLHLVGSPSRNVPIQRDSQGNITLNIGTFDRCWGIIELMH